MKKRLFVAIPISEYLRKIFAEYREGCNIEGPRWTVPENLHITVYFLGYVDEESVPMVRDKIREACASFSSFNLEFSHVEFAPPGRPARMIWAVFRDKNGEYKRFVDSVYETLKGFSSKDFRGKDVIARVTFARFGETSIGKELNLAQPIVENKILEVSSCDLMESRLARTGPAYSIIEKFKLL